MVDCGATKCLQERKNIKKELLSWTKKIPLLIGLEEVTKVVLGKRLSKRVLDITYSEDVQGRRVGHADCLKDWEPQQNCTFCDKKSKFFIGDSPNLSNNKECPGAVATHDSFNCGQQNLLKPFPKPPVMHDSTDTVAIEADCYDDSFDPDQPLDLSVSSQKSKEDTMNTSAELCFSRSPCQSSPQTKQNCIQLKVPSLDGKFPSTKKRELSNGQKRVYTEDELNAAVSEIRSGKIGTRRAAALYGIPRSTLRNKMCRMDLAESKSNSPLPSGSSIPSNGSSSPAKLTVRDILQAGDDQDHRGGESVAEMNGSESNAEMLSSLDNGKIWSGKEEELEQKNRLLKLRHKHDLNAGIERPFGMPPLFYNSQYLLECERAFRGANPYAYDLKLPYLQDLIWRYAQERIDDTSMPSALSPTATIQPGLPTLQELKEYANRNSHRLAEGGRGTNVAANNNNTDALALDLQIPTLPSLSEYYAKGLNSSSPLRGSEAQDNSTDHVSPPTTATQGLLPGHIDDATLKDMLSKTISEKMKQNQKFNHVGQSGKSAVENQKSAAVNQDLQPLPSPPSQPVFPGTNPYESFYMMPNGYSPRSGSGSSNGHAACGLFDEPPHKKQILSMKALHQNKNHLAQSKLEEPRLLNEGIMNGGSVDDQKPAKKTRPKRGQYRKYNHELLMEAVRAVQRGEMSVHRAGSYYGVPHSTLEYKVKERHLLRQKKPREPRKKLVTNGGIPAIESPSPVKTPPVSLPSEASPPMDGRKAGNPKNGVGRLEKEALEIKATAMSSKLFGERKVDEASLKYFVDSLGGEQMQHHAATAQSLQASLLLGSLGASGALPPNFPPLPGSPAFPLAAAAAATFGGWQNPLSLTNTNLPFPLGPDAAATLAAVSLYGGATPGGGSLGLNTSASELLKKLQQKVQAETSTEQLHSNRGNENEEGLASVKPKLHGIAMETEIKQKNDQTENDDHNLSRMIEVAEK